MVAEFRRLGFSFNELEIAIKAFNKEKSKKLPVGDIVELKIVDEPKLRVRVRVGDVYGSSQDQEIDLEAEYLVAALLYRCMQLNIPVPKSPKKLLKRCGEGLELSFSINADQATALSHFLAQAYPDALFGAKINDYVRLTAIADVYSALIDKRAYKGSMTSEAALKIMAESQGQLDTDLLRTFKSFVLDKG